MTKAVDSNDNGWSLSYLGFVGIHQRGSSCHHRATPGSGQERNIWLWGLFWLLFQHVSQPLQIVHQRPLRAFLRPVGLQQAAENSNIKVGGIAGPLAWRYHKRDPVSKGRKMIMLAVLHSKGRHMAYHSAFFISSFTHSLCLLLVHSNILLTDLIPLLLDTTWK